MVCHRRTLVNGVSRKRNSPQPTKTVQQRSTLPCRTSGQANPRQHTAVTDVGKQWSKRPAVTSPSGQTHATIGSWLICHVMIMTPLGPRKSLQVSGQCMQTDTADNNRRDFVMGRRSTSDCGRGAPNNAGCCTHSYESVYSVLCAACLHNLLFKQTFIHTS